MPIGIGQVNPQEPGKNHPDEHRDKRQTVILLADHFVIQAEDVFADEAGRRGVLVRGRYCRMFMHLEPSG
jgi:hypothetical protein